MEGLGEGTGGIWGKNLVPQKTRTVHYSPWGDLEWNRRCTSSPARVWLRPRLSGFQALHVSESFTWCLSFLPSFLPSFPRWRALGGAFRRFLSSR